MAKVVYAIENGGRVPYREKKAPSKKPLRFKNEAEREAHRQEIGRRMVAHFAETVTNPHERKIDSIFAAKRNRMPIYATLPRRNGKKYICRLNRGKGR